MTKKILLMLVATLMSLCAMAQSEFYVVMEDGSAQGYPSEKEDNLTFKNPVVGTIKGLEDMVKVIDALKSELDSLKEVAANCGKGNDANTIHTYVDLGLPSGTLWATCNVGATKPEEYGDYFAWGATGTNANRIWYGVEYSDLQSQGVIDAKGNLTSKYDVATENWGSDWGMPTKDEINELESLTSEYAVVNGVVGRKFIGTNGNTLFLPFAGYRSYGDLTSVGERGNYWSATAYEDGFDAYNLFMNSKYAELNDYGDRDLGCSVRPVLRTKSSVDTIPSIPVDTIPSTPIDTTPNATHAYVDLGLESGTLWAACNIGATKPEEYGRYFAWGETEKKSTYTSSNSNWYGVSYSDLKSQDVIDANGNLTSKYDAATANWGNYWRMPTQEEIEELTSLENECAEMNGVKGRKFIGKNGNTLFLPFAGYRSDGKLYRAGMDGNYWSATARENGERAFIMGLNSENAYWYDSNRFNGFSMRPVLRTK